MTMTESWLVSVSVHKTKSSLIAQCCHFRNPLPMTCSVFTLVLWTPMLINDVEDKELLEGYLCFSIDKPRTLCLWETILQKKVEVWRWIWMIIWEGYDQIIWTIWSKLKKATCGTCKEMGKCMSVAGSSICFITFIEQVLTRAGLNL